MQVNIQVQGVAEAQRRIAQVPRQARYAASRALNGVGFETRDEWRALMQRVFDRPTPYVLDSVRVGPLATPDKLRVEIAPRYQGGKGVDPEKVLLAEVMGGPRRAKRFEIALQRAGILPPGMMAVPATWLTLDPAAADGFGGIKGSFIVKLLSSLRAFGEQGYRANKTAAGLAKQSGRGRWVNGRFYGAHTKVGSTRQGAAAFRQGGVEYFVSRGKGEFTGRGSWQNGQQQHLRAGIWQRSGLYGADVKPVFLFTRRPVYRARLSLAQLAEQAMNVRFPPRFAAEFRRAMETAR